MRSVRVGGVQGLRGCRQNRSPWLCVVRARDGGLPGGSGTEAEPGHLEYWTGIFKKHRTKQGRVLKQCVIHLSIHPFVHSAL